MENYRCFPNEALFNRYLRDLHLLSGYLHKVCFWPKTEKFERISAHVLKHKTRQTLAKMVTHSKLTHTLSHRAWCPNITQSSMADSHDRFPSATAAGRRWCRATQYGMWVLTKAALCWRYAVTARFLVRLPSTFDFFVVIVCCGCLEACFGDWGEHRGLNPLVSQKKSAFSSHKHTTMHHTRGEAVHGKKPWIWMEMCCG